MPEPQPILESRVRFDETDLHGHVFFGEFFTYADETFNELLRLIDYDYDRMHAEGWTTNVVHADLDYAAPADFGDVVDNRMVIDPIGERSLTAQYEARSGGETLATGELVHVSVDYGEDVDEPGAVPVPDDFREAVGALQGGTDPVSG